MPEKTNGPGDDLTVLRELPAPAAGFAVVPVAMLEGDGWQYWERDETADGGAGWAPPSARSGVANPSLMLALVPGERWVDRLGEEPRGFNLDTGAPGEGMPGATTLVNAIGTWVALRNAPTTVELAAAVFNVDRALIEEALAGDQYCFIGADDQIELDGE